MIIGSKIFFFDSLPSTNTYLASLLRKKRLQEGTILRTDYQTAGRGYLENTWESEKGKNLLISIVLYPSFIAISDQFRISMAISLGICDFLSRFTPGCKIKWPNDIYIKDDKIAGMLIENVLSGNKIEFTIAGIGLNINQEEFSDNIPNPVSLRLLTEEIYDLETCLNLLAEDLDVRYKQLIAGNEAEIENEYKEKLYRFNKWFRFNDKDGIFSGKIVNVEDDGRLVIEISDGNYNKYSFKDVEFIP